MRPLEPSASGIENGLIQTDPLLIFRARQQPLFGFFSLRQTFMRMTMIAASIGLAHVRN
jgi:hypothetical protein